MEGCGFPMGRIYRIHIVHGLEIQGSPLELASLSHYLQGFFTSQVGGDPRISEPSTVGFLTPHQKYQKFQADSSPLQNHFGTCLISSRWFQPIWNI